AKARRAGFPVTGAGRERTVRTDGARTDTIEPLLSQKLVRNRKMALADSVNAIAAVTDAISLRLHEKTGLDVTIGRPEPVKPISAIKRLNLFLYEVQFDGCLKNVPLDDGQ